MLIDIDIDDAVYARLEAVAAVEGKSVNDLIVEGAKKVLALKASDESAESLYFKE